MPNFKRFISIFIVLLLIKCFPYHSTFALTWRVLNPQSLRALARELDRQTLPRLKFSFGRQNGHEVADALLADFEVELDCLFPVVHEFDVSSLALP